ncbi:427R [Invertebrate iridescent virus Kaz2018]|uniref:427R n=1 Tax=Invertebrate iridescent virus 6 TaxID=176652 RepID=Q91F98_IIV6|nr:427R [Invertebrate iridescent virus 6]AAK82287.1 427R [Invertebrate iridescent virus 6]QNH08837.1 427R [Invertebrate iridescent virus Kaz2018]
MRQTMIKQIMKQTIKIYLKIGIFLNFILKQSFSIWLQYYILKQ